MRHGESWAQAQPLRQLFDHLSDAVLLLDRQARISFANTAALRSLACDTGAGVEALRDTLGDAAVRWIERCAGEPGAGRGAPRTLPPAPDRSEEGRGGKERR